MNKTAKYISFIIIAVIAIAIIGILTWQIKKPSSVVELPTPTFTPTSSENPISTSTATPTPNITVKWKEYINNELGFSMRIPEKAFSGYDLVPVKVIEDNKNNIIYVGPGIDSSTKDRAWQITVKQVKSDKELETFIQERFGSDCKLGKRNYLYGSNGDSVYSIELATGEEGIDTNCRLGKILYDAGLNKFISIPGGQECGFSGTPVDNYGAVCYDEDIINSFRFK